MNNYNIKTYADSYLFNNKVSKADNENAADKTMKALKDYIIKTNRIDKNSDAFKGIVEEIKRQQRSSIYYTVLMMPNVELCIGPYELPRAFKVSDMKDIKSGGQPKIFIDVTGMIEMTSNGYYICKKIDVLCTYIIQAAVYLLYRYKTAKVLDNSNITILSTECYVSMFAYIIDYLRVSNYATNKSRILYYIAKFYLINIMGKSDDQYTNNVATKISGLDSKDTNAIRLFYVDGMYENIYTFVNGLAESFRLKGFTLEVFITKWAHCFGTGTQYGTELFTSLINIICATYSASYILNQKQVERCCGAGNVAKIFAEIEKAAVMSFDTRQYGESANYESHSTNTIELANAVNAKAEKINESDYSDINMLKVKISDIKTAYNESLQISSKAKLALETGINSIKEYAINDSKYESGTLLTGFKAFKKSLSDRDSCLLERTINNTIDDILEAAENSKVKEAKQRMLKSVCELRESKQYL